MPCQVFVFVFSLILSPGWKVFVFIVLGRGFVIKMYGLDFL